MVIIIIKINCDVTWCPTDFVRYRAISLPSALRPHAIVSYAMEYSKKQRDDKQLNPPDLV